MTIEGNKFYTDELIYLPLVIEPFRWMLFFRSVRICNLWPSVVTGFHGCNTLLYWTELLVFPATPTRFHHPSGFFYNYPINFSQKSWCNLWWPADDMLHNFLSRRLSFLGWTTAMLLWLDFHQAQSNLYKWFRMQLVFNEPKWAHVTLLFISLHLHFTVWGCCRSSSSGLDWGWEGDGFAGFWVSGAFWRHETGSGA